VKPIRGGLLWGLGVALLLAILPATSWATYPGANGRIAYAGQPEGSPYSGDDIYTVLPDGSASRRLTTSPLDEQSPAWSATGRRIAFTRWTPNKRSPIFVMRADGSHQRQVTHDLTADGTPYFSPDGGRIVYAGSLHPNRGLWSIFTIRTDGTDRQRIVKGGDSAYSPKYAPNGRHIVFAGSPEGGGEGIWTVRPSGSQLHRLIRSGPRFYNFGPDYSPDGRHIAFMRCDQANQNYYDCDLYQMRSDGSHLHRIKRLAGAYTPAYSPAGDRIALELADSSAIDYHSNVYTLGVNGSDLLSLTDNTDEGEASSPTWQPIPPP
jgi:TolB protein